MRDKIRGPFDDGKGDLDDDDDFDDEDKNRKGDENIDNGDDNGAEGGGENGRVTLDALETEELEAVETNESATILVDEVSEIKAIRREEMALDMGTTGRRSDEFVCLSCFLLLKKVQMADRENMLCVDCA